MNAKKLELLLSKLPEDKKEAFLAEAKSVVSDALDALLERYGIVLTDEEREFLSVEGRKALSDSELDSVAGGARYRF